jgi:serine/threonine protein kinase
MMPLYTMCVGMASVAMDEGVGAARDVFVLNVALCTLAAIKAFNLAGFAHGDIKPSNLLVSGHSTGVIVLCDLGTARMCGEHFEESSPFSLNLVRTASLRYDVVSLGATLASVLSASLNIGLCGDIAALRKAIDGLSERSSPLWLFVDACLSFTEDGAAAGLEDLRLLLAGITVEMRSRLGQHSEAILLERDVWPRPRG